MAIVFIAALLVGVDAFVSASQRWVVRRRVVAVAAAAARAGAQGDAEVLRVGGVLDADAATARAGQLIGVAHMTGTVTVDPAADQLIEERNCIEALKLIGEHRRLGIPGREETRPRMLCPAGRTQIEMHVAAAQSNPVGRG